MECSHCRSETARLFLRIGISASHDSLFSKLIDCLSNIFASHVKERVRDRHFYCCNLEHEMRIELCANVRSASLWKEYFTILWGRIYIYIFDLFWVMCYSLHIPKIRLFKEKYPVCEKKKKSWFILLRTRHRTIIILWHMSIYIFLLSFFISFFILIVGKKIDKETYIIITFLMIRNS